MVVQSDSAEALSVLSSNGLIRSAYGQLILEIKELMSRRENSVADRLANYSRTERTTAVWVHSISPCIEDLWPLDCNTVTLQ